MSTHGTRGAAPHMSEAEPDVPDHAETTVSGLLAEEVDCWCVRITSVAEWSWAEKGPLTDLVVRDVQRPLHAVLQTRVEAALPALRRERLARVGEVALGNRVRDGAAWSGVNIAHRLATQDDPLTWGRRT